jgi:hypothetical protein
MDMVTFGSHPNLMVQCGPRLFQVNRAIFAEVSPVWSVMLNGDFLEGRMEQIELVDDDPNTLQLALEILYEPFDEQIVIDPERIVNNLKGLQVLMNKYLLKGINGIVHRLIEQKRTNDNLSGMLKIYETVTYCFTCRSQRCRYENHEVRSYPLRGRSSVRICTRCKKSVRNNCCYMCELSSSRRSSTSVVVELFRKKAIFG